MNLQEMEPELLRAKRSELEASLRALAKQREALAISSANGSPQAFAHIERIDKRRTKLAGELETIISALNQLGKWQHALSHMRHWWLVACREEWAAMASQGPGSINGLMQGRQPHDRDALKAVIEGLAAVERQLARDVVGNHIHPIPVSHGMGERYPAELAKLLDDAREQAIDHVTGLLIEGTRIKRPEALQALIDRANHRLAQGV